MLGVESSSPTPKEIEGKKYRVMICISDETGDVVYTQAQFPNNFTQVDHVEVDYLCTQKHEQN